MGTYETIGGTPLHNPEFDIDIPHCCEGNYPNYNKR